MSSGCTCSDKQVTSTERGGTCCKRQCKPHHEIARASISPHYSRGFCRQSPLSKFANAAKCCRRCKQLKRCAHCAANGCTPSLGDGRNWQKLNLSNILPPLDPYPTTAFPRTNVPPSANVCPDSIVSARFAQPANLTSRNLICPFLSIST